MFDRAFPERQIYHRSGGTVRYVSLSPSKQALLALSAVGFGRLVRIRDRQHPIAGPATIAPATPKSSANAPNTTVGLTNRAPRLPPPRRCWKSARRQFERATADFEGRHEVLRSLLEYAGGTSMQLAAARPVERDGARIIMAASIDEAEPRQSRTSGEPYQVTTVGFRARGRPA